MSVLEHHLRGVAAPPRTFACALLAMVLFTCMRSEAVSAPPRADVETKTPLATAALQNAGDGDRGAAAMAPAPLMVGAPEVEDPLDNYQRTSLGDWPAPPIGEGDDPWIRLLLLAPKRPVLIDVAVFVDGRPYREGREAWIDQVLRDAKSPSPGAASKTLAALETFAMSVVPSSDGPKDKTDDSTKKETGLELVAATSRSAPSIRERVLAYATAAGAHVDREEIRWLLADWGPGPEVIMLNPSLSWERAGDAPLLAYLDVDHNGELSADEIGQADERLGMADANGDDVVDESELRRCAAGRFTTPSATGYPLLAVIDANTDWNALAKKLSEVYDASGDASAPTPEEMVTRFADAPAHLSLKVEFGTSAGISLIGISHSSASVASSTPSSDKSLHVSVGQDSLEFIASDGATAASIDASATQLGLGAAVDGGDIAALVDHDGDRRLTRREQRELTTALAKLDGDGDGMLSAQELPSHVRLAVTRGPVAHIVLASPRGAAETEASDVTGAPEWFAGMDQNHDGDLSPNEFLGAGDQFSQLDADGDGLISAQEASASN